MPGDAATQQEGPAEGDSGLAQEPASAETGEIVEMKPSAFDKAVRRITQQEITSAVPSKDEVLGAVSGAVSETTDAYLDSVRGLQTSIDKIGGPCTNCGIESPTAPADLVAKCADSKEIGCDLKYTRHDVAGGAQICYGCGSHLVKM